MAKVKESNSKVNERVLNIYKVLQKSRETVKNEDTYITILDNEKKTPATNVFTFLLLLIVSGST